jgi:hypothetical protein
MRTQAPQTPAFAVPETRTWRAIRVVPWMKSEEWGQGRPGRPIGRPIGRDAETLPGMAGPTPATTGPELGGWERCIDRSGGREAGADSVGWKARP